MFAGVKCTVCKKQGHDHTTCWVAHPDLAPKGWKGGQKGKDSKGKHRDGKGNGRGQGDGKGGYGAAGTDPGSPIWVLCCSLWQGRDSCINSASVRRGKSFTAMICIVQVLVASCNEFVLLRLRHRPIGSLSLR